jgi:hypothetical protein
VRTSPLSSETISISGDDIILVRGGATNVFADVRGARAKEAGSAGDEALLKPTPHRIAMCHLVQVFPPPGAQQVGVPAGSPFLSESLTHHNRLGLFLTWVRT